MESQWKSVPLTNPGVHWRNLKAYTDCSAKIHWFLTKTQHVPPPSSYYVGTNPTSISLEGKCDKCSTPVGTIRRIDYINFAQGALDRIWIDLFLKNENFYSNWENSLMGYTNVIGCVDINKVIIKHLRDSKIINMKLKLCIHGERGFAMKIKQNWTTVQSWVTRMWYNIGCTRIMLREAQEIPDCFD